MEEILLEGQYDNLTRQFEEADRPIDAIFMFWVKGHNMMCYVHENLTSDHLFLFLQFQVSKCGDFGCKEETLGKKEEEKVSLYYFYSVIINQINSFFSFQ